MGQTVFHDLISISRWISQYLPLSDGVPLDTAINPFKRQGLAQVKFTPAQGKHWGILAKTGQGKTTLDKALLKAHQQKYPYINTYILDSKKLGDFSALDGRITRSYEPPPVLTGIGQKQIWQPLEDSLDAYDRYFRHILEYGKPAVILVDESKNIRVGNRVPKGYELILSQGRLPGISVITNYQEVYESLRQGLSQSTHFIAFNVDNPYDLRVAKQKLRVTGDGGLPLVGSHSFMYINSDTSGRPMLFRHYRDFIQYWLNGR